MTTDLDPRHSDPRHLGPPHLEGLTAPAVRPPNVTDREWAGLLAVGWAGALRTPDGRTSFRLRYHGELVEGRVTGGDVTGEDVPALVHAVADDGRSFLLFDGGAHGYDALFCDTWDEEALAARTADRDYVDEDGEDTFELVVWVGYNVDLEEERDSFAAEDDPDRVILTTGTTMPFATARRTAFDALSITAVNARGRAFDVVQEELA
ncbi:hypothetical protein ACRAKI_27930 [Saccharothrix isguenensis]